MSESALHRAFDVELPLPPTMNNAYVNVSGKGRVKAEAFRKWKHDAARTIIAAVPWRKRVGGPVEVEIMLPIGMRGDIDNRIKGTLDALVESGRIDDDRNVVKVSAERTLQSKDIALVSVRALPFRKREAT